MDLTEYRNRNRRPITLPSGLRGFVRAPSVLDFADYPGLLVLRNGRGEERGGEAGREWLHLVLRRCFIPERGVLSVHEVAPEDALALLDAVSALGGERERPEGPSGGGAFPAGEG